MTNHWVIAIGINQYQYLQPLQFAQQDAQSLCEGLVSEAGFLPEHCILMADNSPEVVGRSTYPSRDNLQHWIKFFRQELAHAEDYVWVFFSGYGVCFQGQDYLLPIEGNPQNPEATGVTVRSLYEQLQQLGAGRLLVLLDINRPLGSEADGKLGMQTADLAREFGLPTLLSCRPQEYSHESPALRHGLFMSAVLEGLRSHQCSTLGSMEDFLTARLPEICMHNNHPVQHPALLISDPEQVYQVIMPLDSTETDEWMPAVDAPNPFAIEDDFFDASVLGSDPNAEYADLSYAATELSYEPMSYPSDAEVTSASPSGLSLSSEPILELDAQGDPVTPPRPSATVGQIEVPTAAAIAADRKADTPEEMPDQLFWRRLLVGGGALVLILITGVVVRNWSAFSGQSQAAKNPSPTPVTSIKAEGQAPPVNAKPTQSLTTKPTGGAPAKPAPQPKSSQALLSEAQSLTRPASASDANKAIEIARRIPASDPLYAQAQQDIDRWSRNILEIARDRAKQGQFRQAIAAAQLVPKDRTQIHAEAQKAIAQWRKPR